jgi:hypothetical protein
MDSTHVSSPGRLESTLAILGPAMYKPDHPRAIDRYIDYFGGADATEPRRLAALIGVCRGAR